jgi:hypothetical protein
VVPWFTTDGQSLTLYCDPGHPAGWRHAELARIVETVLDDRRHVLVVIRDRSAPVRRGRAGLVRGSETVLAFEPEQAISQKS